ncbi:ATP/GTP-binding protein [Yinghuangia sp. ASG 101]|uniref:ATP/GTP-binding protein n=1 Tax=Yinghuangia sp. ASG 101 TaxID=2896848 RepID=UPI001E598EFE|nr:ATP/GTP-binding protein [Yinghuangia sp. ASG 101]UGQ08957.1 ATP/GTP-binding protein [Yinghuangia sp. ASG 101]
MPFVVAVNVFDGVQEYTDEEIRSALDLDPRVPTVFCDVRERPSCRNVLLTLIDHLANTPTPPP